MKALLINTSPKNNGATQEILSVLKSLVPPGIEADLLCLGDMDIRYCRGCKVCYDTCQCMQQDDMQPLIDRIDQADILVLASPSYWADVPGQFKVFIDRCTVYSNTNPNPRHRTLRPGKKCYAIALRTGTRSSECEHILETIRHWCGHMGIEIKDGCYFCGIEGKTDLEPYREILAEKAESWLKE